MSHIIIVIGSRIDAGGVLWHRPLEEGSGGLSDHPQLEPGGGGVGENELYEDHPADCTTKEAAAYSVASTIKNTSAGGSPNNWKAYEYGAVLVREPSGLYGPYENKVHTDWQPTFARLRHPDDSSLAVGLVHNHPEQHDYFENLNRRYPGDDDWDNVHQLVQQGKFDSNVVVYILDSFGEVRGFPYSQMSSFRALNREQRVSGTSLPDPLIQGVCN